MKIPLVDLEALHAPLLEKLLSAMTEVVLTGRFILGPKVAELESAIANLAGASHALGVSSGTDALLVALKALGVGPGDEVITTPYSFVATAEVIAQLGARPVFADIEEGGFNLDPEEVEKVLGKRVKAVLPVHLFGRMARMERFLELCSGIPVVEDAAQALGARRGKLSSGACGTVGCLSFFPTKNLGGLGDGGMVLSGSSELWERMRLLRAHGSRTRYVHEILGGNYRLDELQAAVLLVKLPLLESWTALRKQHAAAYSEELSRLRLPVTLPRPDEPLESSVWNQYVILAPRRDELKAFLAENGVATEVYYPVPFHLQPCFQDLGYGPGSFPRAESAAGRALALPVHPMLSQEGQAHVIETIAKFYQRK